MGKTLQETFEEFDYHKPGQAQIDRIAEIRRAAKAFVAVIWGNVKESADRTCAIRKVHEAMMTCNKSIVIEYPEDVR